MEYEVHIHTQNDVRNKYFNYELIMSYTSSFFGQKIDMETYTHQVRRNTSTSSTFDEECEYKKGWQSLLNLASPSEWTKTSKANDGGEVALYWVPRKT